VSTRSFFLPDEVQRYILDTTLRDMPVLAALRDETAQLPQARMQTGADQVQFLQLLVRLIAAKRCIEIGVFTGYSALGVALALPDDGTIVACDVNQDYAAIAHRYWQQAGVMRKIDFRLGPATQTLDALIRTGHAATFDFAYIDADKTAYDAYYERCLVLLRSNGVMTIDNVLWGGDVAKEDSSDDDTVALRNLNRKIGCDERVDATLLPIGDGLMVVRKR
jgi:predicted O-methyltransferase YrrM